MFYSAIQPLILEYGLIAVFVIVMLESAGLPLPGETALVLAAVYAGMTGHFEIPVNGLAPRPEAQARARSAHPGWDGAFARCAPTQTSR